MMYPIFVSLLFCVILFTDDVEANFTKENCLECCRGLTTGKNECDFACHRKWYSSQNYHNRYDCKVSCRGELGVCQVPCKADCDVRFPTAPNTTRSAIHFTTELCNACCLGLGSKNFECQVECHMRSLRSHDYNSLNECYRSCRKALSSCQHECRADCDCRYEEIPRGQRPLPRREKKRREVREAREAAGDISYHITKKGDKKKRKRDDAGPSGGS